MKPHDRAHAGGGHGIGGLEVHENITQHSTVESRTIASLKSDIFGKPCGPPVS